MSASSSSSSSSSSTPPLILSPLALSSLLSSASHSKPRVLDATWFMPNLNPPRDPRKEFEQGPRIPESTFWGVDEVATRKEDVGPDGKSENPLGLAHMMPSAEKFADSVAMQGISPDTHVVVYDTHGIFSSPRTAFTFFAFGHTKVSILDGGLPGWIANELPLEEGPPKHKAKPAEYPIPKLQPGMIRSYEEMLANAAMGPRGQIVLDARPRGRFDGTAAEPRPGLPSGHIPSSLSLPFSSLLVSHQHPLDSSKTFTTLKSQTDLWRSISDSVGGLEALEKLRQASSAGEPGATASCGSGMTAAVLWAGLNQLGVQSAIYDESWTGYALHKESPIEKAKE